MKRYEFPVKVGGRKKKEVWMQTEAV